MVAYAKDTEENPLRFSLKITPGLPEKRGLFDCVNNTITHNLDLGIGKNNHPSASTRRKAERGRERHSQCPHPCALPAQPLHLYDPTEYGTMFSGRNKTLELMNAIIKDQISRPENKITMI